MTENIDDDGTLNISSPVDFRVTAAQKKQLESLKQGRSGKKEDVAVEIKGHMTGGKLYIQNLDIEFLHRWMDCMTP